MRRCFLLLLLCVGFSALRAEDKPVWTKDFVLKSIADFREDPMSDRGLAARYVITNFSQDSPDIRIVINDKNYPIEEPTKASKEEILTLLAAFIAGNVESQLLRGLKKQDDAYAGDLQMIRTYRQLQDKNRKLKIPGMEKMAELEKRGELKRYLSSK